jgi:alpha-amylase
MQDIALAGYTAIQTSPVNECYDGGDGGMDLFGAGKWYYHYQPTDWTIGNYQLGTKEEFTNMCNIAESYGIKVIVDVAPNHTTKTTDAINKNFLDAVGGLDKLYHSNGMEAISNYDNRTECTLMGVGGLYDVNTESKAFQDYFIKFMNDCIACGADGFRFDTAKHIGLADDPQDDPSLPNNFWDRVLTEIDKSDSLFNYGEVLQDGGERIADYINKIGATTASSYGAAIRNAIYASNVNASSIISPILSSLECSSK